MSRFNRVFIEVTCTSDGGIVQSLLLFTFPTFPFMEKKRCQVDGIGEKDFKLSSNELDISPLPPNLLAFKAIV